MENKIDILVPLCEKVENYAKTSFELYTLKTINNSANILSSFISSGLIIILISIIVMTLNIGAALWLGEILGKPYYGFFCVAGFYVVIAAFVYPFMNKFIKKCVSNSIIPQLLN